MFKKSYLVYTTMILVSIVLGACSATPSNNGLNSLPTQAMTEVASIVNNANNATQKAGTPITASGSNASQGTAAKTPGTSSGSTTQSVTMGKGTPAATLNSAKGTPAASSNVTAVPKTPEITPGSMTAALDWTAPWLQFISTIPADFYTISVDKLASMLQSGTAPFLLDVRDTAEVSQYGYIKGAVNIPYQALFKNLDKLPAIDKPIIVYSGVGHRGTITMSALRLLGYTNVVVLDGGMTTWLNAGQPAELGTPPKPTAGTAPKIDTTKIKDLEKFIATGTYGIDANELNSWLADPAKPIVIDVSEPAETKANGVIKNALQIPLSSLLENLNKLPTDMKSPIVIVDSTGHRGTIAMMAMRMIGYNNVRSLFGGIQAWIDAGLPTIK
jgi:rhodanese-related sulfurtransferase